MKARIKKLFFLLILSFAVYSVPAQKVFIRIGGGYNMPLALDQIGVNITETKNASDNSTTTTNEAVNGGYGQSINLGLRVGYMFSEYVGADLGLNYHIGMNQEVKYSSDLATGNSKFIDNTSIKSSIGMLMLTPSFILSTSQEGKIVPYVRAGVAIGIQTSNLVTVTSNSTETTNSQTESHTSEGEIKFTTSLGIGMTGGVGVDIHLGDKFGVYGEVNFLAMRISATEAEITKNAEDGKDDVGERTISQKKFVFEDKIEQKSNDQTGSPDQPTKVLTGSKLLNIFSTVFNYNFVGLNVGIKLRF